MRSKNKVLTLLILSSSAIAVTAFINKVIKISAISKDILFKSNSYCYKWKFGNIHYTKSGSGQPILLVHNLAAESSSFEFSKLENQLNKEHTVYTIDLLGCGKSEKPILTYTNYLFVQLLSDFIRSEIGHRTDIVASGNSSSIAIMACANSPELFNNLLLICPSSISSLSQIPGNRTKIFKWLLDLPILGTLIYNIGHTKKSLFTKFSSELFCNPYLVSKDYINAYYESAYLGNSPKSIYSSVTCNYTQANIGNALKKIDNSIYIIQGAEMNDSDLIMTEYKYYNPAIEFVSISKTKMLPHLENTAEFCQAIEPFLS